MCILFAELLLQPLGHAPFLKALSNTLEYLRPIPPLPPTSRFCFLFSSSLLKFIMRCKIALLSLLLACGTAAFQFKNQIPGVFSSLLSLVGYDDAEFPCQNHVEIPKTSAPVYATATPYWLEHIHHQGVSAFNPDQSYQVFRNVKDFGAKG